MKKKFLGWLFILSLLLSMPSITAYAEGMWMNNSIGRWYKNADGSNPAGGWQKIDERWYYFNEAGYMKTGWVESAGKLYYLDDTGAMVTGWQRIDNEWYCFDSDGAILSDWLSIGDVWVEIDKDDGFTKTEKQVEKNQYTMDDYQKLYQPVIDQYTLYYEMKSEDTNHSVKWIDYGVSECCEYDNSPGYAILDVDGDGIMELMIGNDDEDEIYPKTIFCLYTVNNGAIQKVFGSGTRSSNYYMGNATFLNEGSSGAAYTLISVSTYSKGELTAYDGVMSSDNYNPMSGVYWYRSADTSGRYPEKLKISDDEAFRLRSEWESQIIVPELTPLFEK